MTTGTANAVTTVMARMAENGPGPAMRWCDQEISYDRLFALIDDWVGRLGDEEIGRGTVCGVFGDYSPETQQKDIHAFVQTVGLTDLVIMGLSMGGRNAFTYASSHGDDVRALVIVDAGPENMRSGSQNIRQFVQQDDELDSVDAFVQRFRKYNPRRDPIQVRGSMVHNLKQLPNGKWTWKYDRLLRGPSRNMQQDPDAANRMWSYLEGLTCPTLVVRGAESDIIAMETAGAMHERIPNGRLATVPGAGHLVMGDNPAGFEQAVTGFLSRFA